MLQRKTDARSLKICLTFNYLTSPTIIRYSTNALGGGVKFHRMQAVKLLLVTLSETSIAQHEIKLGYKSD